MSAISQDRPTRRRCTRAPRFSAWWGLPLGEQSAGAYAVIALLVMDGNYRERPAQELHPVRRVKAAQTAAWLVSLDEDRHAAIEIMQCVPAFPRLSSPRAPASIRIFTCCPRPCAPRSPCPLPPFAHRQN